MNIAYLCTDFGIPVHGTKGAAIHVRELCRALAGRGHVVRIYTPRAGGPAPEGFDVPVRELPLEADGQNAFRHLGNDPSAGPATAAAVRSILYSATLPRRLAPELEAFRPDLIYERHALFGTAGLALSRMFGVPLILEVNAPLAAEHARYRGLGFAAAARGIERDVLQAADRVIAVSGALADWAVDQGVARDQVVVLPNAVDADLFAADPRAAAAVRHRIGAGDRPVVGFVGSLKPWHDTATLVHAMDELVRLEPRPASAGVFDGRREEATGRGTAAHLLIVGDGPERGRIEALVQRCGLGARTTFAGAVPHAEVPAWLAAMDVAVAPYAPAEDFYFSPLKLYEYMAAGRPVVAADVGPLAEAVRRSDAGRLYAAGNARALADALAGLIADPVTRTALGAAGRAFVRRNHTWDGNARVVERSAA